MNGNGTTTHDVAEERVDDILDLYDTMRQLLDEGIKVVMVGVTPEGREWLRRTRECLSLASQVLPRIPE